MLIAFSRWNIVLAILVFSSISFSSAEARTLTFVTDLISTSLPSTAASHVIEFSAYAAVPASGKIVITPVSGAFLLPVGFDYSDMTFEVRSGGVYSFRTISSTANAANDGISISSGDVITITLNSTTGLLAGQHVRISLLAGARTPLNPSLTHSYKIRIETQDQTGNNIDIATAMIAIIQNVGVSAQAGQQPMVAQNGRPTGDVAAGNATIELTFETNRPGTCKYDTVAGTPYSSMTNTFSSSGQIFYTTVTGHVNDTTYSYYIRCKDNVGAENTSDFVITFTLLPTPISNTSIASGGTGSDGRGGAGSFPNGSSVLFLAQATLSGVGPPSRKITTLTDGVPSVISTSGADGSFTNITGAVERGTYTFTTYVTDDKGKTSASFTVTQSMESGTHNRISNIILPPTVDLEKNSIDVGADAHVTGLGVPKSLIELYVTLKEIGGTRIPMKFAATSTPDGLWDIIIPGKKLTKGTYSLQARVFIKTDTESGMSKLEILGVGQAAPSGKWNRSDLNHDGKVNLVDFSILLSFWGTTDSNADINGDGNINLADFSIMLFNWTG